MRRSAVTLAAALVVGIALGGTIFSDGVALAAQLVSATITGPLDANGNVQVADQTKTELIDQQRYVPNEFNDYDLSRYKQVRFGIGTTGGCTASDFLSFEVFEPSQMSVGTWYYCQGNPSATFETLGRTVRVRCVCGAFIDIVIFGRAN